MDKKFPGTGYDNDGETSGGANASLPIAASESLIPTPKHNKKPRPVLEFTSWLDWSPFVEDERGAKPLWYRVSVNGPVVEGSDPDDANDWIAFGTVESFTAEEYRDLWDSLAAGDTHALRFHLDTSYSDACVGSEWGDYFSEGCTIELGVDAHGRLQAEVHFDDTQAWVESAKDLHVTRLTSPELLRHDDYRMWQLLAMASPQLRETVGIALRHPLESLLQAPRYGFIAVHGRVLDERNQRGARLVHFGKTKNGRPVDVPDL